MLAMNGCGHTGVSCYVQNMHKSYRSVVLTHANSCSHAEEIVVRENFYKNSI